MEEDNYKSVVNDLKLSNGLIFGLPVVFDTDDERVVPGATVLLQYKNVPIAVFHVRTLTLFSLFFIFLFYDSLSCMYHVVLLYNRYLYATLFSL